MKTTTKTTTTIAAATAAAKQKIIYQKYIFMTFLAVLFASSFPIWIIFHFFSCEYFVLFVLGMVGLSSINFPEYSEMVILSGVYAIAKHEYNILGVFRLLFLL